MSNILISGSQKKPWTQEKIAKVIDVLRNARVTMNTGERRKPMEYYWMAKYDIITIANEDHLIFKRKTAEDPTVCIIPREHYFDVLSEIHETCGHGGRDKMLYAIKTKFYITKKAIETFVSLCPSCETKRNNPKKGSVTRSNGSQDFRARGEVDFIDFQSYPDGEYKWLLVYHDNGTKFSSLRPLKTKTLSEVATELLKIFLTYGIPHTLHSENEYEFTAKVIEKLTTMWPDCKVIHGHQTHRCMEKSSQNIESLLRTWMADNKSTNWSLGCFFVQYQKNTSFHSSIEKSPYQALFGSDPKASRSSDLPSSILVTIEAEEPLRKKKKIK